METKKKHKTLIAPLIGSAIILAGSSASLFSAACDKHPNKPNVPKQKDYQEAVQGAINYVALGDQYASLYNDENGGYFDAKNKTIYGLSYASYLANFINMMANKKTYLNSYYNFGLSNANLDDWLHLINPNKYKVSNETLRHLEFNKQIEQSVQIEKKNKNSLLFNDFQPSKNGYDFLLSKLKNANLITLSVSLNDFLSENECFDLMWKTLYSKSIGQDVEPYLKELNALIDKKVTKILEKYNNLVTEIRKINSKANINLVGYASPFLKLVKLFKNELNKKNYLSEIINKINNTIEKVSKTHKLNFVTFDNLNNIQNNINSYSNSFLSQSPNLNAFKKLAQDLFAKITLNQIDYQKLIKNNSKYNPQKDEKNLAYYKALEFFEQPSKIKNDLFGLLADNIETYKKNYIFEQTDLNKNLTKKINNNKYNQKILATYKIYFNNGKHFSNTEIINFLENIANFLHINSESFFNTFEYIKKSINDEKNRKIIVDFVNSLLENELLNKAFNDVNYQIDLLFSQLDARSITIKKVVDEIEKFIFSKTKIFNQLKSFINSDFLKQQENKKWFINLFDTIVNDLADSKYAIKTLFGSQVSETLDKFFKDIDYKKSFKNFLAKIVSLLFESTDIINNTNDFDHLINILLANAKVEFTSIINKTLEQLKTHKDILEKMINHIFAVYDEMFKFKDGDKENIRYFIKKFIENFSQFDGKEDFVNLFVNIFLQTEGKKDDLIENVLKTLTNAFVYPKTIKYSNNEDHQLLFQFLGFMPNEANLDKQKYLNGLKGFGFSYLDANIKVSNFTEEDFRNNFLKFNQDFLNDQHKVVNTQTKEIVLNIINKMLYNFLEHKSLFYETFKNLSNFVLFQPLINYLNQNGWTKLILEANPQFKTIEEFTDNIFKQIYDLVNNNDFISSVKLMFKHVIDNNSLYKFNNPAQFVNKLLANGSKNNIKNVITNLFNKLGANSDLENKLFSIFNIWLDKETNTKLNNGEQSKIKTYVTSLILNIPQSEAFIKMLDNIFDKAKELDKLNSYNFNDVQNALKNVSLDFVSLAKNSRLIAQIIDLVFVKPYLQTSTWETKEVLKTYAILLGKDSFVNYLFTKFDLKKLLLNSLDKISFPSWKANAKIEEEFKSLLNEFKNFINDKWDNVFLEKIKKLITTSFSNDIIDSSTSLEAYTIEVIKKTKDIILEMVNSVFDEFLLKAGNEQTLNKFSDVLISILENKIKDFKILDQDRSTLSGLISKLIKSFKNHKIFENLIRNIADGISNNIKENGFDFAKFDLSRLFNISGLFSLVDINDIVKIINEINSAEILSLGRTLFRNIASLLNDSSTENASISLEYQKIYTIVKSILSRLDSNDRKEFVSELANALKDLKGTYFEKILDVYLTNLLAKLDKKVVDDILEKMHYTSTDELIKSLKQNLSNVILDMQNINLITEILNNVLVENYNLYESNTLEEFIIKLVKLSKTNGLDKLLKSYLKAAFNNQKVNETLVHFMLSYLTNTIKISLTSVEYEKLFKYFSNVLSNLPKAKLFDDIFEQIINMFNTIPSNLSFEQISKNTINVIISYILSKQGLNKLLDIMLVKTNNASVYTISEFSEILKILFKKPQFVDFILQNPNIKTLIVNGIANIKLDDNKISKKAAEKFGLLMNYLKEFIAEKYDLSIVPLFKKGIESLFADNVTDNISSLTEWFAKALENIKFDFATKLDALVNELINNSKNNKDFKETIAWFLIELADHDLININWPNGAKDALVSSISKLLTALPKLNIFKAIINDSIGNIIYNIKTNSLDPKNWEIKNLINFPTLINNLNYDELNKFIKLLTSQEIRDIMLMLLENIEKFANIISNTSTLIVSRESKIDVDINKLFAFIKTCASVLNDQDRIMVKGKLPKLFVWFKSEPKFKEYISQKLNFIKEKILELNKNASDFATLIYNKLINTIFELDATQKLFDALLSSLISLDNKTFTSINDFNDLFKHLVNTNKSEIKQFIKELVKSIISDESLIEKSLKFILEEINKKYQISTTSADVDNIVSMLKRAILKINDLNFLSQITDDLIDLIADLKLFNNDGNVDSKDILKSFIEKVKKVEYAKYLTSENMGQIIETILSKDLDSGKLKAELLSIYYYITKNISKFKQTSSNSNSSSSHNSNWLKTIENLIFNLALAANGSIKSDNQTAKDALTDFIYDVIKDQINQIDFKSLKLDLISNEKFEWIIKKVIAYDEIKGLVKSIVEDYLGGSKINSPKNLGELMSSIILKIKTNLEKNITAILKKFAKDDEVLKEVINQVINMLSLENVTEDEKTFLKDLASSLIEKMLETDLYKRKLLKRSITQFSNFAKEFNFNTPKKFILDAINKIKSAFGAGDIAILTNYIGENNIIDAPKLVKLINLIFGRAKSPDSVIYKMLKNINYDSDVNKRTNMTTLNNLVSLDMLNPKPKGDPNDPDNITVSVDPLTTLDAIFKLLGKEVDKEATTNSDYYNKYIVRSKQPAYQATYRLLTTMNLAIFEMFGRETLEAKRDKNSKLNLYSGVRSILWEVQEGTNLSLIPFVGNKFAGMQRYFKNVNIRHEFTNYVTEKTWYGKYKYYDESNYGPDSITYLTVTSGYNDAEKDKLKNINFKTSENGVPNTMSKKDYILQTIKEGGYGRFMKINNKKSINKWSGLDKNNEWY